MSRPSAAHTPLAREAGRRRGPLRSNGKVRGVPVISFFAVPRSQTAAIFTSRSAPSDRAPLTLPTLTRWAPPSPRCLYRPETWLTVFGDMVDTPFARIGARMRGVIHNAMAGTVDHGATRGVCEIGVE